MRETNKNNQNHKTPLAKFSNLENPSFPRDSNENQENPIVLLENHGTLENHRIPLRITTVMKIL